MIKTKEIELFVELASENMEKEMASFIEKMNSYTETYKAKGEELEKKLSWMYLVSEMGPGVRSEFVDLKLKQQKFSSELTVDDSGLSQTIKMFRIRKQRHYLIKVKCYLKMCHEYNLHLKHEMNLLSRNQTQTPVATIKTMTISELGALKEKIKRYQGEINKLQKRYTWLEGNANEFDFLTENMLHLEEIVACRRDMEALIAVHHGLSPVLPEALKQLSDVKKEHHDLAKKLLEKQ